MRSPATAASNAAATAHNSAAFSVDRNTVAAIVARTVAPHHRNFDWRDRRFPKGSVGSHCVAYVIRGSAQNVCPFGLAHGAGSPDPGSITTPGDGDHMTLELRRELLGHGDILPARTRRA